jgi:PHP family Zn ribbon phosphoesterase
MKKFRADLHVHTVLSPCADVEMIPPLIVQTALEKNIDLIAITDHNASANVAAVQKAAEGNDRATRMEVITKCSSLALFRLDGLKTQTKWTGLPDLPNQSAFFGEQFVVDETGEYIRTEERLLSTATHFSIDEIFEHVDTLGGIVIPAHVERTSYGLFPTLGLISEKWHVLALEISRHISPEKASRMFAALGKYPLIQSGDVHQLDGFLGTTVFTLASPSLMEIRMAFKNIDGREVQIETSP